MQYKSNEYDPDKHDRFKALVLKQPYAEDLATGAKTIEVRSTRTTYRGDLLICSSATPVYPKMMSGVTLGFVELYDCKPISEFTAEDWEATRIPHERRKQITKGYGWLMRNPRRVIEYPIKGQLGIYHLVYTKGVIEQYPTQVVYDDEAWAKFAKKIMK